MSQTRPARASLRRHILAPVLVLFLSPGLLCAFDQDNSPARPDDQDGSHRSAAQSQFARAEALRATLQEKGERERSLKDYQAVVSAYRRVFLITPRAVEVPSAIKMAGDLYRKMGEQFGAKYFTTAVVTYQFLLHDYPLNRYREETLLAIAGIQRTGLAQADLARQSYEQFLKQYPRSPRAAEARKALTELEAEEKDHAEEKAAAVSVRSQANARTGQTSEITGVRSWNADNYTRIIIELRGQPKYQAARIADPDRIYFDIENAKLSAQVFRQPIAVPSGGFLKTVRLAQNRSNVVRLVLEVTQISDYSVFELSDPDRLIVDVYGPPAELSSTNSAPEIKTAAIARQPQTPAASRKAPETPATPSTSATKAETAQTVGASDSAASAGLITNVPQPIGPPPVPKRNRNGERSLTRTLGLKIGRMVIDAGHGGHDRGTVGLKGLTEKDLCLDIALRLGKLIQRQIPSANIIYTRQDDSFVPLEQRTEIANNAKADLFLSIHANSSDDAHVRGIETYYLNFNASPQAMEVAARENALAQSSVHDLQDLVKKIARNEKIGESRDLAMDIQESLANYMRAGSRPERNRGVRKAPFVVLIGADMPSVLAEISFLSNPADEQWLKKPENRQRVAEGLYHGIEKYLQSTNSVTTHLVPPPERDRQP